MARTYSQGHVAALHVSFSTSSPLSVGLVSWPPRLRGACRQFQSFSRPITTLGRDVATICRTRSAYRRRSRPRFLSAVCVAARCAHLRAQSSTASTRSTLSRSNAISRTHFECVPSTANIADLPSCGTFTEPRAELVGMHMRGRMPNPLIVPSVASWRAPLDTWAAPHPCAVSAPLPLYPSVSVRTSSQNMRSRATGMSATSRGSSMPLSRL